MANAARPDQLMNMVQGGLSTVRRALAVPEAELARGRRLLPLDALSPALRAKEAAARDPGAALDAALDALLAPSRAGPAGPAAGPAPAEEDAADRPVKELLRFFKHEFFQWCNNAPCEACGATDTSLLQVAPPATADELANEAGRVEVYQCPRCPHRTRFPRYNNPVRLLQTRRGRCGEWANAFLLLCRAAGHPARYVLDATDHVWAEVFLPSKRAFVHADPCENALDSPHMYALGWKKKLSYILAFGPGPNDVADVTRRYVPEEEWTPDLVMRRVPLASPRFTRLLLSLPAQRLVETERYFAGAPPPPAAAGSVAQWSSARFRRAAVRELARRRRARVQAAGGPHRHSELLGRTSGADGWRAARGEATHEGALLLLVFHGASFGGKCDAWQVRDGKSPVDLDAVRGAGGAGVFVRTAPSELALFADVACASPLGTLRTTTSAASASAASASTAASAPDWDKLVAQAEFKARHHALVSAGAATASEAAVRLTRDLAAFTSKGASRPT